MGYFLSGFVAGLFLAVPFVVVLIRKNVLGRARRDDNEAEIEQLGKLTGQLAHEIRNPLSTIKVNLKLVSEELGRCGVDGRGRVLRKIDIIRDEADRLNSILDNFLRYYSRPQYNFTNGDLNEVVADMVDFYSPQATEHNIRVRCVLFKGPLICKIDGDMLKQALLNLFINAQHAMENGGELMVRTDKSDGMASIMIGDTGCGIDADAAERIFEAYYSTRPQGSGLGLATAKKIVDAHNGVINVDSEKNKGTLFTISLPTG